MKAKQGACPPGFQAHHIFPEELYGDDDVKDLLGSNPHTNENGIYLPETKADYQAEVDKGNKPAKTLHKGKHSRYTKHVKGKLMEIKNSDLPPCKKAEKMAELQANLREQLKSGTLEFEHARSNGKKVTVKGVNKGGVV